MSMITVSLSAGTWTEIVDLDDPTLAFFYLDTTDEVIGAIEAGTPDASSAGFLLTAGPSSIPVPAGKSCWVKLTSGAADITYSQFDGVLIDSVNCAFARSDGIAVDEVVSNVMPIIGYDDSEADPVAYTGLLHTEAAGVSNTATIDAASMTLQVASFRTGRTIRIYGIEEAASITSSLTDYASLASGQTLTTAFVDVTFDGSGIAFVDLTTLLQELIDDTASWTTSSPVQLWIGDQGSTPTSGLNETAAIAVTGRASALFVRAS